MNIIDQFWIFYYVEKYETKFTFTLKLNFEFYYNLGIQFKIFVMIFANQNFSMKIISGLLKLRTS